jgi:hypothetical protein
MIITNLLLEKSFSLDPQVNRKFREILKTSLESISLFPNTLQDYDYHPIPVLQCHLQRMTPSE